MGCKPQEQKDGYSAPGIWMPSTVGVARTADWHGALLVFDTVRSGLGTTGAIFAAALIDDAPASKGRGWLSATGRTKANPLVMRPLRFSQAQRLLSQLQYDFGGGVSLLRERLPLAFTVVATARRPDIPRQADHKSGQESEQ